MFVLVVPASLSIGVIESQVIGMVKGLFSENETTILFVGKGSCARKEMFERKYPEIHFENSMLWLISVRRKVSKIYSRSIFNYFFLYIYKKLLCPNLLLRYDFRGLISEESYLRNKSKFRLFILKKLELYAFKTANEIYAVSDNLKNYLLSNYGTTQDISVIPCCIDASEIRLKKEFSSDESYIKFIYVGSMSAWQCFDKICKTFHELEKIMPAHLMVLTNDVDAAISILKKNAVKNFNVKSGYRRDVLKALSQSDFGFIYRENNIVNLTASPIKFIEYTSQGVIPLITEYVGDYSKSSLESGISINLEKEIDVIEKNIREMLNNNDVLLKLNEYSLSYSWQKYLYKESCLS